MPNGRHWLAVSSRSFLSSSIFANRALITAFAICREEIKPVVGCEDYASRTKNGPSGGFHLYPLMHFGVVQRLGMLRIDLGLLELQCRMFTSNLTFGKSAGGCTAVFVAKSLHRQKVIITGLRQRVSVLKGVLLN